MLGPVYFGADDVPVLFSRCASHFFSTSQILALTLSHPQYGEQPLVQVEEPKATMAQDASCR